MNNDYCRDDDLMDDVYHIEPRSIYDQALLGYEELTNRAVYSRELIIKVILETVYAEINERNAQAESEDEHIELDEADARDQALEYYEHNILGSYVGDMTPLFISNQLLRDD